MKGSPRPGDAPSPKDRLRGLHPEQARQLRQAIAAVNAQDRLMAGQLLFMLQLAAPAHPEVLRWAGQHHLNHGEWPQAVDCLSRSVAARPDDFEALLALATAQYRAGDFVAAAGTLQQARNAVRATPDWLALSLECDRQGHVEDALSAVEQVLQREPRSAVARLQRARCLKATGQAEAAAADCRALIARGELVARAWFSLLDLKTVPLQAAELPALKQAAAAATGADDRLLLDFALGKALEDAGDTQEAFETLVRANHRARTVRPWDGAAFARQVASVRQAFAAAVPQADEAQGAEVIFLVGLPRSGTTLVEQVLASHSKVEGASELPYLAHVLDEESRRRGKPFPAWVPEADATDWARLGRRYLSLSARWRAQRPVCTDKLPENWLLAGAALRMLPQARVLDCRRDAVETCWSCFKQLFGPNQVGFTYGFDSLAAYWHDYVGLSGHWAALWPDRFHVQHYEALVADAPGQIRALLAFCGLPFEDACLEFHKAHRAIRTPSALQVRQPLRRVSTPAAAYGALLDPLRQLLVST